MPLQTFYPLRVLLRALSSQPASFNACPSSQQLLCHVGWGHALSDQDNQFGSQVSACKRSRLLTQQTLYHINSLLQSQVPVYACTSSRRPSHKPHPPLFLTMHQHGQLGACIVCVMHTCIWPLAPCSCMMQTPCT